MHQTFSVKALLNTKGVRLIFQYSRLFPGCLLRASWVNECKAFHLVYVCQRRAWKPGPLNAVSVGPLIEPDQFTETASRLAQLPHQRDSNNCTLWPLLSLKKPYLYLLQSQPGSSEQTEKGGLEHSFFEQMIGHKAILEQFESRIDNILMCTNTIVL